MFASPSTHAPGRQRRPCLIPVSSSCASRSTCGVAALVYGLFLPRHRRMDLVVVYALFNLGLFLALVVISRGGVSMGVGFGLFAVLSIVRLRSEPYSNRELAYFFVAIVLALVCAIDIGHLALAGVLATVLLAAWAVDHPRLPRPPGRASRSTGSSASRAPRRTGGAPRRPRARRDRARGRLRARDDGRRRAPRRATVQRRPVMWVVA